MKKKRFYDLDVNVAQAVQLLMLFPDEIQSIIADGLSYIAEREFKANEILKELKSLGRDKVLAIYNSQKKRRDYDKNPSVHRAMNYLMILSDENRRFIAQQIIGLMGYLQNYLKACRKYESSASLDTMESITGVYLELGVQEVQQLIRAIESEFKRRLDGDTGPSILPLRTQLPSNEGIQDETAGLRVRHGFRYGNRMDAAL